MVGATRRRRNVGFRRALRQPTGLGSQTLSGEHIGSPLPSEVGRSAAGAHGRAPLHIIYISIGYLIGEREIAGRGSQAGAGEPAQSAAEPRRQGVPRRSLGTRGNGQYFQSVFVIPGVGRGVCRPGRSGRTLVRSCGRAGRPGPSFGAGRTQAAGGLRPGP